MARYSTDFVFLMPSESPGNAESNELIENFWGALWLGIQPILCSTSFSESRPNADSNELVENFLDALWLGIRPICVRPHFLKLDPTLIRMS